MTTPRKVKNANYQDSFEELYMRYDYLKRIESIDENQLKKHALVITKTSRLMYDKYQHTFNKISFYYDDIYSITSIYATIFFGLYSYDKDPKQISSFRESYFTKNGIYPTQEMIDKRERNLLISFLRQKLMTCNEFCTRKARNVVVNKEEDCYFIQINPQAKPHPKHYNVEFFEQPNYFGYRALTPEEMEVVNMEMKLNKTSGNPMFNGAQVVVIKKPSCSVFPLAVFKSSTDGDSGEDISSLFIPNEIHSSLNQLEDDSENYHLEKYKYDFNSMSSDDKKELLKSFILTNKSDLNYKSEVKTARSMLKTL